jgi:helicase
MRVLGLFVGVDEQEDETVRVLSFAGKDAEALWASFADMNEADPDGRLENTVPLLGRDAGRDPVLQALQKMVERSRQGDYDLAIIHFSCHGTPAGGLLLYDARSEAPEESALSLEEVGRAARLVKAEHVVVSFDTCFSGAATGMLRGASDDRLYDQMRALGTGNRAVITAALASQPALESARLEHGLLSFGLLRGLDGTTLANAQNRVSISAWMELAVRSVLEQAEIEGRIQTPSRFLEWAGDPAMPAVPPGRHRRSLAARRAVHPVGADVVSLGVYGFSEALLEAIRGRTRGLPLNDMQVRAINEAGVLAGNNVVVAAPTSSGKTLIGELAVLAAKGRRRKAVVLLPSRALASEKWAEFRDSYGPVGIRAVRSYGGVEDDDAALGTLHFDVAFLTYEKFLLLGLTRPSLLDAVGAVVFDEVHLLRDPERGRTAELLLTLCRWQQSRGKQLQIVALSAALSETNGFEHWLEGRLVTEAVRPVPLREGVISPSGRFRYLDSHTRQQGVERIFHPIPGREPREWDSELYARVAVQLSASLVRSTPNEQLLLFRAHKPDTRRLAGRLCDDLDLGECEEALTNTATEVEGRDYSRATRELLQDLERGVGFHVADLEQREREAIESAFRTGALRCLVATSGLAMGINTPVTSVVVVDHQRFSGELRDYDVGEYKNMVGRAGRWIAGVERGTSYLVAADDAEADDLFERYVLARPEPLISRLAGTDRLDLTLALLTMLGGGTESEVLDLARLTFDGFLNRASAEWRATLREDLRLALETLEREAFVVRAEGGKIEPTPAGLVCGREAFSVESAIRALAAAEEVIEGDEQLDETALVTIAQCTRELDSVYMPTGGQDGDLWPQITTAKLISDRPALSGVLMASSRADLVPRAKRLFAVARWLQGVAMEQIEKELSTGHSEWKRDEPMAGAIRQAATRTGHVLRAIAKLIAMRHPTREDALKSLVLSLRPRLEYGIAGAAAGLARHRLGLSRGEVRGLFQISITDLGSLREALEEETPEVMAVFGSLRAYQVLAEIRRLGERAPVIREADDTAQMRLFDEIGQIDLSE